MLCHVFLGNFPCRLAGCRLNSAPTQTQLRYSRSRTAPTRWEAEKATFIAQRRGLYRVFVDGSGSKPWLSSVPFIIYIEMVFTMQNKKLLLLILNSMRICVAGLSK
jgi:hypothetical protein